MYIYNSILFYFETYSQIIQFVTKIFSYLLQNTIYFHVILNFYIILKVIIIFIIFILFINEKFEYLFETFNF